MTENMTLAEIQTAVHATALEKGWWDEDRTPGEILALVHSEVSEALEELRTSGGDPTSVHWRDDGKPEGFRFELADAIIRILDYAEYSGIDMSAAIAEKDAYNKTREHRHGGKWL